MKHRLDLGAMALKPSDQPFDRHDIAKIALGDVAPFIPGAEAVDDHQIGAARIVEGRSEDRTDKPATAGYYQHQAASSLDRARAASASAVECAVRIASISRVVERPSIRSTRT